MELAIGTVQFGMNYGVFNQEKKDVDYCIRCLDYATQNGINAIDTATAYGIAEQVTGKFLKKRTISREKLFVSTKLLPNILDDYELKDYVAIIRDNLIKSLQVLNLDYVDAYFLHSSRYAHRPDILAALEEVKKEGLACHVGVSVYDTDEAIACIKSPFVDYIQAPYSVFDHRMKEEDIFKMSQQNGCTVDTRTAFVKGLIRLSVDDVPDYLADAKPILDKLDQICKRTGYTRIELALNYIKREKEINHLVFGIRDLEQLQEDIIAFNKDVSEDVLDLLDQEFTDIDTNIVIPSLWKK